MIGTRGSLLALTQCLQMKNTMEQRGLGSFELKIINTQGDENTQAPLWQLEGKDFFTKELDTALLRGEVDLVVHSYKDLGSERPEGITLATITERKYANDILLIKNETIQKLQNKEISKFVVGTSSPRRMTNIERFLKDYLPYGSEMNLEIECSSLRGNVNTRIEKLISGQFDAIVLALPGIERLAQGLPDHNNEAYEKHGDPREILTKLFKDLNFMILPLSEFPAAASQGALAIECLENRDDGGELLSKLQSLSCERTLKEVALEREVFQSYGGGCHLAVGISASWSERAGLSRLDIRGKIDDLEIDQHGLKERSLPEFKGPIFIGVPSEITFKTGDKSIPDQLTQKSPSLINILAETEIKQGEEHILIASGSALEYALVLPENYDMLKETALWSSGTRTMKKIAQAGLWCQGSADSLGEDEVLSLSNGHLAQIKLGQRRWNVITNSTSESPLGPTIGVYDKSWAKTATAYQQRIEQCGVYYWTSYPQYEYFNEKFNLNFEALHCCGLGKTLKKFKAKGLEVMPFSSMKELKNWIDS